MARAWTFRYMAQKMELSVREAMENVSPGGSISDYWRYFYNVFNKPLTVDVYMAGAAMLPTLGQLTKGPARPDQMEKLVVRQIRSPSASSVFVGDVVAFSNPREGSKGAYLVRRVAATEGDEMESSHPGDTPFSLEPGMCWVLADNTELTWQEANDSRTFGPVSLSSILGRVVYYHRSPTEHGFVENSEPARWMDEPVLECEVDPDSISK